MNHDAYDPDNIFAKILRGEIPSHRIYEDDRTVAFMDVMPQSRGHALVVPKHPSRNLIDADSDTLSHLLFVVQKVARAARIALHCDGVRIAQFNEAAAGQTVFHLHFHVIPVYESMPMKAHASTMEDGNVLGELAMKYRVALDM